MSISESEYMIVESYGTQILWTMLQFDYDFSCKLISIMRDNTSVISHSRDMI